jgi:hypothetical protein
MSSLQDKIEAKNQNGEERDRVPSKKLINPPPANRAKKINRKAGHNSTGKDPNLGKRTPIER